MEMVTHLDVTPEVGGGTNLRGLGDVTWLEEMKMLHPDSSYQLFLSFFFFLVSLKMKL